MALSLLTTLAYHNYHSGEKSQFGRRMKAQDECRRLLHLWLGGRLQAGYWKRAHATKLITSSSNKPTCVEDTINSRMVMTPLPRKHIFIFKRLKKKERKKKEKKSNKRDSSPLPDTKLLFSIARNVFALLSSLSRSAIVSQASLG